MKDLKIHYIGTLLAISLVGCEAPNEARYRMTVEVDTPAGVRTGTSVRELEYFGQGGWFPFGESRGGTRVTGQAVAVVLPNGKTLYALMTGRDGEHDYGATVAAKTLGPKTSGHRPFSILPLEGRTDGNVMPMLAFFEDQSDARTIVVTDQYSMNGDFGPGYSLKSIVIEYTDDRFEPIELQAPSLDRTQALRTWFREIGIEDPRVAAISGFDRGVEAVKLKLTLAGG
ncbi:hypothetical protein [Sphingopyxis sp. MSC1_008]|jgi:hypothetical protein